MKEAEVRNAIRHADHFAVIAAGTPREVRSVLDNADEKLVRALTTAAQLAHAHNKIPPDVQRKHSAKLATALSRTKALRTKHKLVTSQRGGAFWKSIVRAALPVLGGIAGATIGPVSGALGSAAGKALAPRI